VTVFYLFVLVCLSTANTFFKIVINDEMKDGAHLTVKVLSYLMAAFLFVMQIPLVSTLLQGFLCDEDSLLPTADEL
jgi:hypothetical protein